MIKGEKNIEINISDQTDQYVRFIESITARISELKLDPESFQRVLDHSDELRQYFLDKVVELAKSQSIFKHDKSKEGWELLEDIGFRPVITSLKNLEIVPFLESSKPYINGKDIAERAKQLMANLGQKHAEYLLEHQSEIPREFQNYSLVFPGTKWRRPAGDRRIPYLYWYDGEWILSFYWLDHHNWYDDYRLVRPRE